MPTRDNGEHLAETALLDYGRASLRKLICDRGWLSLPVGRRIGAVYSFVRDEIPFGYNISDRISASQVLADGYGQCNTKTILLMALLRGVGIPCRVHGATIHKRLQKGVVNGLWYRMAPRNIIHTWAEVRVDGRWVAMEGVILDSRYLDGLRALVSQNRGAFLGYAVGTDDLASPPVDWKGGDTAIQMTGVNSDLGSYDDPDAFYAEHGANLLGFKEWLYRHVVRQRMNGKVASIRGCPSTPSCVAHSALPEGDRGRQQALASEVGGPPNGIAISGGRSNPATTDRQLLSLCALSAAHQTDHPGDQTDDAGVRQSHAAHSGGAAGSPRVAGSP